MQLPIDPVWLTSHQHLERFQEIRDKTPWYRVLLGGSYRLPDDFPCIQVNTQRIPLVYWSTGALSVAKNLLTCAAHPPSSSRLSGQRRNLDTTLAFSIDTALRPKLGRFRARTSPNYFSINWIELAVPERSLLLCAGGRGPGMGRVNRGTDSLFNILDAWASGSA